MSLMQSIFPPENIHDIHSMKQQLSIRILSRFLLAGGALQQCFGGFLSGRRARQAHQLGSEQQQQPRRFPEDFDSAAAVVKARDGLQGGGFVLVSPNTCCYFVPRARFVFSHRGA